MISLLCVLLLHFICTASADTELPLDWTFQQRPTMCNSYGACISAQLNNQKILTYDCQTQITWIFDASIKNANASWSPIITRTQPPKRIMSAMAQVGNGTVLLYGGVAGPPPATDFFDDSYMFDVERQDWEQVSKTVSPPKRAGHAMAKLSNVNQKVLLFGGFDESTGRIYNDNYYFDGSIKKWTTFTTRTTKPLPRYVLAMGSLSDGLVLMNGGRSFQGSGTGFNDTWVFDASKEMWIEIIQNLVLQL